MARMNLNQSEQALIEKGRELAKLQAKKRQIAAEQDECEKAIAKASEELHALTAPASVEK